MNESPQLLLHHHLKKLRLPTFLSDYDKLARQCAAENKDHVQYLLRLSELELIERERRMIERRIKAAKFPAVKSLDSFDFKAMASLNKPLVMELAHWQNSHCPWPRPGGLPKGSEGPLYHRRRPGSRVDGSGR
jgi:DNA replication protein DnaC